MDKTCDDGRCKAVECKAQPAEYEGMVQPLAHISHLCCGAATQRGLWPPHS